MNMNVLISVQVPAFTYFGYVSRNGTAGLYNNSRVNFQRKRHTVSHSAVPFSIPTSSARGFGSLHILASTHFPSVCILNRASSGLSAVNAQQICWGDGDGNKLEDPWILKLSKFLQNFWWHLVWKRCREYWNIFSEHLTSRKGSSLRWWWWVVGSPSRLKWAASPSSMLADCCQIKMWVQGYGSFHE